MRQSIILNGVERRHTIIFVPMDGGAGAVPLLASAQTITPEPVWVAAAGHGRNVQSGRDMFNLLHEGH